METRSANMRPRDNFSTAAYKIIATSLVFNVRHTAATSFVKTMLPNYVTK